MTDNKEAAPRGRKPKGERSLTNAERQAEFRRKRITVAAGEQITATINELARDFELTKDEVTQHLLRFALCNRNWKSTGFPSRLKTSRTEITNVNNDF